MGRPTSPVDICNLALSRLGQRSVSSITAPVTESEKRCALHYEASRRELLRRYVFNFSKKLAVLTADPTVTPAYGYGHAYPLPVDNIRFLAIGDTTLNQDTPREWYDFSEDFLYTDRGNETPPGSGVLTVNLSYIFDQKNVVKFDALFVRVLWLTLARDMAYGFKLSSKTVEEIRAELGDAELAAAAVAGQEKPPRRVQRSRIRDARRMGGLFRDSTRIG